MTLEDIHLWAVTSFEGIFTFVVIIVEKNRCPKNSFAIISAILAASGLIRAAFDAQQKQ